MSSHQTTPSPWNSSFSEQHTVETPEQIAVAFDIAGVGSRFLALLIDSAIQFGILLSAGIAIAFLSRLGGPLRAPAFAAFLVAGVIILGFLLLYGYFALFEIFWNGQTPGKRTIGIRVIKDSGRRLSPVESIGRNLLRIVDQLPGFYAIGALCALLNKQNKRLGDLVAGSLVVRESSIQVTKPIWQEPSTNAATLSPLGADRLTPDDVVLIEAFLQRRHDLQSDVRYRMASNILRRLDGKLTVDQANRPGVEQILEAAVHERRSRTTA